MNFNPADYEQVQDRITRFYTDHEDGRVITNLERIDGKVVIFSAKLFETGIDQLDGKPKATGWAHEIDGEGFVNKHSHLENCETSAIGRALANAGYSGSKNRASLEEMQGSADRDKLPKAPEKAPQKAPEGNKTTSRAPQVSPYRAGLNTRINEHIKANHITIDGVKELKIKHCGSETVSDDQLAEIADMLDFDFSDK